MTTTSTGVFDSFYKIQEDDKRLKEYVGTLSPTDELVTVAYLKSRKGKYESILELRQVLSSFRTAQMVNAIGEEIKKMTVKNK